MTYKKVKVEQISEEQAYRNLFEAAVKHLNVSEDTYIIRKQGENDYRLEVYSSGASPKFVSLASTFEEAILGWYEVITV